MGGAVSGSNFHSRIPKIRHVMRLNIFTLKKSLVLFLERGQELTRFGNSRRLPGHFRVKLEIQPEFWCKTGTLGLGLFFTVNCAPKEELLNAITAFCIQIAWSYFQIQKWKDPYKNEKIHTKISAKPSTRFFFYEGKSILKIRTIFSY